MMVARKLNHRRLRLANRNGIVQPSDKVDWKNLSFDLAPTNGFARFVWVGLCPCSHCSKAKLMRGDP